MTPIDYDSETERLMTNLYNSLSEKDRRRYAAVEAKKIGHGGLIYIATLFRCDQKTIKRGLSELGDENKLNQESIRMPGGGAKAKIDNIDHIDEIFLAVLKDNTAGEPMNENIKWTNLSRSKIIEAMAKKGINISKNIVKKLLKKHEFVKKSMEK